MGEVAQFPKNVTITCGECEVQNHIPDNDDIVLVVCSGCSNKLIAQHTYVCSCGNNTFHVTADYTLVCAKCAEWRTADALR